MKRFISSDGKWEVTRLSSKEIQVSNIKTYTSFVLDANVNTGTLGSCGCSYGKQAGTICPHVKAQREFVAAERAEMQAPVVVEVKPVDTLAAWLKEQEAEGMMLFA